MINFKLNPLICAGLGTGGAGSSGGQAGDGRAGESESDTGGASARYFPAGFEQEDQEPYFTIFMREGVTKV